MEVCGVVAQLAINRLESRECIGMQLPKYSSRLFLAPREHGLIRPWRLKDAFDVGVPGALRRPA